MKSSNKVLTLLLFASLSSGALAIPSLQVGPGSTGDWSYDGSTKTWVTSSDPFSVDAFANATANDGGNGDFAWDPAGAGTRSAYIVFAATPGSAVDAFDISVSNDGASLSLVDSGYGNPPDEDPNSLAGHGIYDTWFEIYQFDFDGPLQTIADVQPGETGTGMGYAELIDVTINSLLAGVTGIHMDLFTVGGDGIYSPGDYSDRQLVNAFAPFSHDAEYGPPRDVPEPGSLAILALGLIGLVVSRKKFAL